MIVSFNEKIPIYTIFILILIVCAEYLKELMPCKLDNILKNNIYVKHFFCFLTLLFFVVITTEPLKDKNLKEIIVKSIILYILFILLIKNDYRIFLIVMVLLGLIYIISIKKYELIDLIEKEKNKDKVFHKLITRDVQHSGEALTRADIKIRKTYENEINIIILINNILFVIVIILIFLGFLFYMNKKKNQYKDEFNFLKFFFGTIKCKKNLNN
jgi:hypothetical protein